VEKGFEEADYIFEGEYETPKVQHAHVEPHVTVTYWDEDGRLVLRSSTQVPFHVRRIVAWVTGLSEEQIKVIKPRLGGGFGGKQDPVLDDLVAHLVIKTGRPVRLALDRKEEFETTRSRHAYVIRLKMGFRKDGTITAANASKIDDGASALVLASQQAVDKFGLKPLAKIVGYDGVAQDPSWFTTAPAKAITKLLDKLHFTVDDIDLFEINEAFAVVTMHSMTTCKIDHDKVNVHGGAVSLGHPIGCSGARITTTLLHAMRDRKVHRGVASLCIGGGEALALAIELV
jgi:acetyl-CoA acetyltransferase family protein